MNASNDPLHGKKLADILEELLDYYGGFEGLSRKIEIRVCWHFKYRIYPIKVAK